MIINFNDIEEWEVSKMNGGISTLSARMYIGEYSIINTGTKDLVLLTIVVRR